MKKTTKLIALIMALLMVATTFVACGAKAPAEEPAAPEADAPEAEAPAEEGAYIGKVTLTLKHDVHGNDSIWAEKYAKEQYGATYEVIDPDQDLAKQIAGVETFISKGVDGIILHPVTEDGVNEIIQEVRDADINILCYNLNSTDKAVPFLAIDEAEVAYQMGADMAKQWMELYPDKPVSVGFISWTDIAFCFDNRTGPFIKGVKSVVEPDTSANPNPAVFQNSNQQFSFLFMFKQYSIVGVYNI